MTEPATAILGGSALIAGTSLFGASKAASAQKEAAKKASQAEMRAIEAQLEMYYQGREDLAPWREAGGEALNKLIPMIEAGPGKFVPAEQPGYKFGYQEFVEKPTLRMAAATGGLGGGGTQKALTRYASDYASTKYDNFLNRWYQSLTPWQSLAGIGQTAAGQTVEAGLNTGRGIAGSYGNIGQNALLAGQARASGYTNMANVISGGVTSGMENYLLARYLKNQGMANAGTNYPSYWQGSAGAAY